jgi:hypothetical protein
MISAMLSAVLLVVLTAVLPAVLPAVLLSMPPATLISRGFGHTYRPRLSTVF